MFNGNDQCAQQPLPPLGCFLSHASFLAHAVAQGRPFVFTIGVGQVIRGWDEGMAQVRQRCRPSKGGIARAITSVYTSMHTCVQVQIRSLRATLRRTHTRRFVLRLCNSLCPRHISFALPFTHFFVLLAPLFSWSPCSHGVVCFSRVTCSSGIACSLVVSCSYSVACFAPDSAALRAAPAADERR